MTRSDVAWLLALAGQFCALIWITHNSHGAIQPLLMPWPLVMKSEPVS